MLERLLPKTIDNRFRGHRVALWMFYPITLMTIVRSLIHVFRSDGGAQSIATIPLDSFTEAGVATIVAIFAQWGLSQLLMGGLYALVLARYRALIPLMYVLILIEYAGRVVVGAMKPIVTLGTPPGGPGSIVLVAIAITCVVLCLRGAGGEGGSAQRGTA
jgi:hypothetical protein